MVSLYYFEKFLHEADARIETAFYELNSFNRYQRFIGKLFVKDIRFICEKKELYKKEHPDWSEDRIEKEIKKALLKKIAAETLRNSSWRRAYEKQFVNGMLYEKESVDVINKLLRYIE